MLSRYRERIYRKECLASDLVFFTVSQMESDLFIKASRDLSIEALSALKKARKIIKNYIKINPLFFESLIPIPNDPNAHSLIQDMIIAGNKAKVGPFASVAGAVAEYVGNALLEYTKELIIENGGDIFMKTAHPRKIKIFTDNKYFEDKICINIKSSSKPSGLCTSSGITGPSLSFGNSDAVTILSESATLSDAVATAIGNIVKTEKDIDYALLESRKIDGITGALIIIGRKIGIWGDMEFV